MEVIKKRERGRGDRKDGGKEGREKGKEGMR